MQPNGLPNLPAPQIVTGGQPTRKPSRLVNFVRFLTRNKLTTIIVLTTVLVVSGGIIAFLILFQHHGPWTVVQTDNKPVAPPLASATSPITPTPPNNPVVTPSVPTPATKTPSVVVPKPSAGSSGSTSTGGGGSTGGGSSSTCSGRPNASCTGVPAGTVLANWTGGTSGYDSTSNKTYDGLRLPVPSAGYWTFAGNNITIKNSIIGGGVVFTGDNIRIEHSDIPDGLSLSGTTNVTMLYNNIHDWDDGIHITSDSGPVKNIVVSYNYVHAPNPPCGAHSDAVQLLGVDNITITYNTLDLGPWFQKCGEDVLNSAFQIENTQGPDTNMNLSYNYLNGGGITARFYACSNTIFTGNRFGRNYFYSPVDNSDNGCFTNKSGNVWDDTGLPLTF